MNNGCTWFQGDCGINLWHSECKKHYLGLSDNVTYFSEQLDSEKVSSYNYRVIFKPESIIPDIDLHTSLGG